MADRPPAGNAEPEHHHELEVNIGQFRLRLTGQAATIIATTGTFAIAGYCVYKVLNSEKLTDCIAHAITKGSVEIEIIAGSEDAANQALPIFSSNKLLEMFNKALDEYSAKHNHDIGKFDSVKLIHYLMSNMKANELLKLKNNANDLKEKYEHDLNITLQRSISEEETTTTTTTTTTTKVIKRNVSENFMLSSKNATSSAKQQEMVRKECTVVEKSTQTEPVATETCKQIPLATKEKVSMKSSSTQTDPVNIILQGVDQLTLTENGERQPKLTLEDIFSMKDDVSNTDERNFDEDHDVMKEQIEPLSLSVAKCLHRCYHTRMEAEIFSEISIVVEMLFSLIQGQIQITAEDVHLFAKKLRSEKKFIDAHLFFQIASKLHELDPNPNRVVDGIRECVAEMCFTHKEQRNSSDNFKPFIINYAIPVMHDLLLKIQNTKHVDIKYRTLQEAWCIHYICLSCFLVKDWASSDLALRQGIVLMRYVFEEDAVKHQVYGRFLNNLGAVYRGSSQVDKALEYFQLAIDANNKAIDFGSEEEKEKIKSITERNIAALRRQLATQN